MEEEGLEEKKDGKTVEATPKLILYAEYIIKIVAAVSALSIVLTSVANAVFFLLELGKLHALSVNTVYYSGITNINIYKIISYIPISTAMSAVAFKFYQFYLYSAKYFYVTGFILYLTLSILCYLTGISAVVIAAMVGAVFSIIILPLLVYLGSEITYTLANSSFKIFKNIHFAEETEESNLVKKGINIVKRPKLIKKKEKKQKEMSDSTIVLVLSIYLIAGAFMFYYESFQGALRNTEYKIYCEDSQIYAVLYEAKEYYIISPVVVTTNNNEAIIDQEALADILLQFQPLQKKLLDDEKVVLDLNIYNNTQKLIKKESAELTTKNFNQVFLETAY